MRKDENIRKGEDNNQQDCVIFWLNAPSGHESSESGLRELEIGTFLLLSFFNNIILE